VGGGRIRILIILLARGAGHGSGLCGEMASQPEEPLYFLS